MKGLDLSKGPKLQPHIISCWRLEDYNRKNFAGRIGSGAVAPWWHPCPTIGPAYVQSLRTSQGGFRKLHVPTQAHHDAFLHTTALMSGPLLQMKNICLLGRMSSGFRKTKPLSRPCLSLCQLARAFILWQSSFSTPFFAGPVLEAYTSFTTQNHPMKRYNWSVWWEEARCMCDADRFSIGFRFHKTPHFRKGLTAHKINGICLRNLLGQILHPHPLEAVSILAHHLPNQKANNCQRLHLSDWSATCFDTWPQS